MTAAPEIGAMPNNRGSQYATIQALRFFAALAVVVVHSSFYTAERLDGSMGLWSQGANGVRLFFVISGFVMIVSSDTLVAVPGGWRVFAVKRIVRIVPMYWAATGFKLVAMLAAPGAVLHARLDWGYIAKSLLFWPAYNVDGQIHPLLGVGWTLTFEMFFYALFAIALFVRLEPVRALAPLLVVLAALSPFRTLDWPVALACWADPIVLDFLAGMLLGRWVQAGGKLAPALAWLALLIGASYLFLPVLRFSYGSVAASLALTIASTLILAGAVSLEAAIGARIPRSLLFLGATSYALYLVHPLAGPAVPTVLHRLHLGLPVISIILSIALAIVVGVLCHLFIEQPATRVLTRHVRRLRLLESGAPRSGASSVPVPARTIGGDAE